MRATREKSLMDEQSEFGKIWIESCMAPAVIRCGAGRVSVFLILLRHFADMRYGLF